MAHHALSESAYDRRRLRQWSRGEARTAGLDRRAMLRLLAAAGAAAPLVGAAAGSAAAAPGAG
ncbi:sulfite oxidase, partial [Streptomyces zhihengii]